MFSQLRQVNNYINASTRYRTDLDAYGKADFWQVADGYGDCEDYALAKRQELIRLGWSPDILKLAVCKTEFNETHAVLTVDLDDKTYVLDNRFTDVKEWHTVPYKWMSRQSGHMWVEISA